MSMKKCEGIIAYVNIVVYQYLYTFCIEAQ